jgi:single-strand DNA-binding protein
VNSIRNRVLLIGHLGKDPELKTFDSGKQKAAFPLATSESYKDKNGDKVEDTHWHNVIAWESQAKLAENFLKKGSQVAVEGKLTHRKYEDKEGNPKYVTEVIVNDILLLGKKV